MVGTSITRGFLAVAAHPTQPTLVVTVWKADAPQDDFASNLAQTRYRGNAIVTSVCVDGARVALRTSLSQQMACRLTRVQ
jgi:hypothetical protein